MHRKPFRTPIVVLLCHYCVLSFCVRGKPTSALEETDVTLLLNNLSESARERPVDVSYFEDDELSLAIMLGGASSSGVVSGARNVKRSTDWINRIETQDDELGANYTIYNVGVLMASHLGMLLLSKTYVRFDWLCSVMNLINICFNYLHASANKR